MDRIYEQVKEFLENLDKNQFLASRAIVWIDWREYDEDIIAYFNQRMEDKLLIQLQNNGQPYGDDIVLIKGQEKQKIPYKEKMDRDTTIQYLNDFIKPQYEIRWFIESLGSDTLGFVLMKSEEWRMLEDKFTKVRLDYYFSIIGLESKMFELSLKEVDDLLKHRQI